VPTPSRTAPAGPVPGVVYSDADADLGWLPLRTGLSTPPPMRRRPLMPWIGRRSASPRPSVPVAAVLLAAALPLAACGTDLGSAPTTTVTVAPTASASVDTTQPTGTGSTTTAPTVPSVLSSITAAVVAFENRQGLPSTHYVVRGVTLSTTDPTWAKFEVDPAAGYQGTVQNGYGIAHDTGGWTVTGIGSSGVGCGGRHPLPEATLNDLGLTCP
jgi:hypothetical protein